MGKSTVAFIDLKRNSKIQLKPSIYQIVGKTHFLFSETLPILSLETRFCTITPDI